MIGCRHVFALTILLGTAFQLQALEPEWSCALAGDVIAGPVISGEKVLLVLSDRTLTCLSDSGSYFWRKPLSGRPSPFLAVSSVGQVFTAAGSGALESFSSDGCFLWRIQLSENPSGPMLEGRDGRLFIPLNTALVCLSPQGAVKWTKRIPQRITMPLAATGDGDILVSGENTLFRLSPFGEILEAIANTDTFTCFLSVPGGFIAANTRGVIKAFDVRNGRADGKRSDTECVWIRAGNGNAVTALAELDGTVMSLSESGTLAGFNRTDGETLWQGSSGLSVVQSAAITSDYGQFTVSTPDGFCAVSGHGALLWHQSISGVSGTPVMSDDGRFYAPSSGWVLRCFRPESRIKSEKKHQKRESYDILNGKSAVFGISVMTDMLQNAAFFDRVGLDISSGSVGVNEVDYARRLAEILSGDVGNDAGNRFITGSERGRAASLLGQLGSFEYREVLLGAADDSYDESAAIGLLYGIAATGADFDGRSLSAIRTLSKVAGSSSDMVQKASCDALYAVVRYSAGVVANDGARMLAAFLYEPYSTDVRNYAMMMLGNILH